MRFLRFLETRLETRRLRLGRALRRAERLETRLERRRFPRRGLELAFERRRALLGAPERLVRLGALPALAGALLLERERLARRV